MAIKRADKAKNIDKVTASLVKEPLQTARELASDTGIGASTANRARKEVAQNGTKDDRIHSLNNKDFNCIKLGVEELERRLGDREELEKMRATEISQVIKENTARYTLFAGNVTDSNGGLKMTKEEEDLIQSTLKANELI